MSKHYAERDIMELDEIGNHYINHVSAMTSEKLHGKSDIAAELGYRDMLIEKLTAERDVAWQELREIREAISANPEESTADEARRVVSQKENLHSAIGQFQGQSNHWHQHSQQLTAQNAELVAQVERLNNFSNERIARAAALRSVIEKVLSCEELVFNSDVVLVVSSELADDIRCTLDSTPNQHLRDSDAEVGRAGFVAGCLQGQNYCSIMTNEQASEIYAEKVRRGEV